MDYGSSPVVQSAKLTLRKQPTLDTLPRSEKPVHPALRFSRVAATNGHTRRRYLEPRRQPPRRIPRRCPTEIGTPANTAPLPSRDADTRQTRLHARVPGLRKHAMSERRNSVSRIRCQGTHGQFRAIAVAQPSDLTGVDQDRYRSRVMPDPLLASQQAPPRGPRGPVMSYRWPTHSWPPLRRSVLKCRTRPTTDLGRDLVTACCASPARLRSDRASLSQLRASVGLMWAVPTTLALVG